MKIDLGRREVLRQGTLGLGALALAQLLCERTRAQSAPTARAKRVVYLHMAGAPSHLDLFDPKSALEGLDGKPVPDSFIQGERFAFIKGHPKVLASPYKFAKHGQSGAEFSELLPRLSANADRLAVVRSMHTTEFNHAPAQLFLQTGHARVGRPSFGSWISYGLGSLNRDLPTFVVLTSGRFGPDGGASLWGPGFLPGVHQGVRLSSQGDPVLYLADPEGLDRAGRRRTLDTLGELNRLHAERTGEARRSSPPSPRNPSPSRRATRSSPARRASATTACWRAGCSSAACASCSSTTGAGTATARARTTTS